MKLSACLIAVAVVTTAACSGSSSGGNVGAPANGDVSGGPTTLTSAQLGKDWPLKNADSAIVACVQSFSPGSGSVVVTINGTAYALNGTARQSGDWPDFLKSGYWRDDPALGHGLKVSIDPLIEAGLKDCDGSG